MYSFIAEFIETPKISKKVEIKIPPNKIIFPLISLRNSLNLNLVTKLKNLFLLYLIYLPSFLFSIIEVGYC